MATLFVRACATLYSAALVAVAFPLGACTGPTNTTDQVACLLVDIVPWMADHYATTPSAVTGRPLVEFADQGILQRLAGRTDAIAAKVYGLQVGNRIVLWNKADLASFGAQSTLAHEVAHWIDFIEQRQRPHTDVYAIQQAWERAHWSDGTGC